MPPVNRDNEEVVSTTAPVLEHPRKTPVVIKLNENCIDGGESNSSFTSGRNRYHYPTAKKYDLQIGQVRALDLLLQAKRTGQSMSRARIKMELGISPLSGTLQTWFDGIGEGTKRGRARKGLFAHGFVVEETLDVEGVKELTLELTPQGMQVALELEKERDGKPLPELRSASKSTNRRYLID